MAYYWKYEVSGQLHPAIQAYLNGEPMTDHQAILLRLYLTQWIDDPRWLGPNVDLLRASVRSLTTRQDFRNWFEVADRAGVDPL
jgi:hypothetical protein